MNITININRKNNFLNPGIGECMELLNINSLDPESLPFSLNDATSGTESELQVAVEGRREDVDLPNTIETSDYFYHIIKRISVGDTSKKFITKLERYLDENDENIWENSWVRFHEKLLSSLSRSEFYKDLKSHKNLPQSGMRGDIKNFFIKRGNENYIRVPISYLVKLALTDIISSSEKITDEVRRTGLKLAGHFLNDNTSPETFSFHVVDVKSGNDKGKFIAKEYSKRFLFTQLLAMYANKKFNLIKDGQKVVIFSSPLPPVRQKKLNECISDNYYRELFMSPCLSGWNKGEEKKEYMNLCHRTLSLSQLNAIEKLREAGIINNNLVVLPNTSNISLANNGTHISMGSKKLSSFISDSGSGFTGVHEKYIGDLVIKITEHFLPLFVNTYSGAPYRMEFSEFNPETSLGFLPHELDYTHLRMIWRRWKKKAGNKIFGKTVTPYGPHFVDKFISKFFRLKGDFIYDFRLIDYFAALMSTENSSPLNGQIGNTEKYLKDIENLGIFHSNMSPYLLVKLREFSKLKFSGFESRYYSLFDSFSEDLGCASVLQMLVLILAYRYIALGLYTHESIPHDPVHESERRQIFFGTALGIPTFYVKENTGNAFLFRIISGAGRVRKSGRYSGYLRIHNIEYRKALINLIKKDAADIIELLGCRDVIEDLEMRIYEPDKYSALGKLTCGILKSTGAKSPMKMSGDDFNRAAEKYYRNGLRKKHIKEAFKFFDDDFKFNINKSGYFHPMMKEIKKIIMREDICGYMNYLENRVISEDISVKEVIELVNIMLIIESREGL